MTRREKNADLPLHGKHMCPSGETGEVTDEAQSVAFNRRGGNAVSSMRPQGLSLRNMDASW